MDLCEVCFFFLPLRYELLSSHVSWQLRPVSHFTRQVFASLEIRKLFLFHSVFPSSVQYLLERNINYIRCNLISLFFYERFCLLFQHFYICCALTSVSLLTCSNSLQLYLLHPSPSCVPPVHSFSCPIYLPLLFHLCTLLLRLSPPSGPPVNIGMSFSIFSPHLFFHVSPSAFPPVSTVSFSTSFYPSISFPFAPVFIFSFNTCLHLSLLHLFPFSAVSLVHLLFYLPHLVHCPTPDPQLHT